MYSLNVCKFTCVTFYGSQSLFMVYDSSIVIYHTKLSKWGEKVRKSKAQVCSLSLSTKRCQSKKVTRQSFKKESNIVIKMCFLNSSGLF